MGQAAILVEFDDGGLGIGAELGGGGADGIGSLQGVASLHASLAVAALTEMNGELAVDRLAGNFGLELLLDVGFVERSAAIGADVGQRCLVGFVDLLGWRGGR